MTRTRFMAMALTGVIVAAGLAIALNAQSPTATHGSPGASLAAFATGSPRPSASARPSGSPVASPSSSPPAPPIATCKRLGHPEWTVARQWDEHILEAIRNSLPNPPVHARNLFHLSVAMWDAWAAYDPVARGYVFHEKLQASDTEAARREAISYAAFRVLSARFENAVGGADSLRGF